MLRGYRLKNKTKSVKVVKFQLKSKCFYLLSSLLTLLANKYPSTESKTVDSSCVHVINQQM